MVIIKCNPNKRGTDGRYGCNCEYPLDEYNILDVKYLTCPNCSRVSENPFFSGEEKQPSYIG